MLVSQVYFNDTALPSSASVKRPIPTKEMIERRNQILNMEYGERSLRFLLEEGKLRRCGLLGKTGSTDDWLFAKYPRWQQVSVPRKFQRPKLVSPVKASKRSLFEGAGAGNHLPDNSSIRANPNLAIHRFDRCPSSSQIKYNTDEIIKMPIDQYGSNELEELSHIRIGIDSCPLSLHVPEHGHVCSVSPHSPS